MKTIVNGCKQFSDIQVHAMGTPVFKQFAVILTLGVVHFTSFGLVQASEAAALKVSKKLSVDLNQASDQMKGHEYLSHPEVSLLDKLPLFRGVAVNEENYRPLNNKPAKAIVDEQQDGRRSTVSAVYGGIQISLQENLSLIYAPGRLSGQSINSESQGLYLLANRGGLANWFMGVESRSYGSASEARRTANSAQFGVIVDLD